MSEERERAQLSYPRQSRSLCELQSRSTSITATSTSKSNCNCNCSLKAPLVKLFLGESNLRNQIELIVRLQESKLIAYVAPLASGVSLIGSGKVILIVLCILLWLGDAELGWKPSNAATHMLIACGIAKAFLKGPRPYFIDRRIKTLDPTLEESYGFPSGHTSGVVSIYGLIATFYCDKESLMSFGWMLYLCICILVGVSRVYTGAHFVTDVMGGMVLGIILLWNELRRSGIEKEIQLSTSSSSFSFSSSYHVAEAIYLFSLSIICFGGICFAASMNKNSDGDEKENANKEKEKENEKKKSVMIDFKLNQEGICGAGFALGLGGCHLAEAFISQSQNQNPLTHQSLSLSGCLAGFAGLIMISFLIKIIQGKRKESSVLRTLMISIGYSFIMVWALWLTPLLFTPEASSSILTPN